VKFNRRHVLQLTAGAAALPILPRLAAALAYPSRPVRMIVAFPPGNAPDIVARLIGQWLSDQLGQPIVIDNRPGAASNIGTEAAVRSAPDGYTIMITVLTNVLNQALYKNLSFNFLTDVTHVAGVANAPYVIVITPSLPAQTFPEFIAYAKANPGKINMASGGKGASSHIFGELLKIMAGIDIVHVPYRSNYVPDLISGQVHMLVAPMPQGIELVRSGKLRAIAVTTAKRQESLPDIPTVSEFVPGYEAVGWYGLGVPKGTPAEIVNRLNAAMNKALADPKLKERIATLGVEPMPMTPAEFTAFIGHESDKWTKVIKAAGVTLD
jgi:tripartite-type tricarboxylate transporter receptor subunit TctC